MPVVRHGGNNIVPACTDTAVGAYVANQETDTQKQPESSEVTESQETTEPEETKEPEEVTESQVEETIAFQIGGPNKNKAENSLILTRNIRQSMVVFTC